MKDVYNRFRHCKLRNGKSTVLLPPNIYAQMTKDIKGNILDIGTGDGYKLENILNRIKKTKIHRVRAIEPSSLYKNTILRFAGNENVEILNKRIENAELEEDFWDTILMFDVIEHLSDTHSALNIIINCLKPNGVFICCTPNKWVYRITAKLGGKSLESTHVNEMTYGRFFKLMNTYFEETRFMGTFPYMRLGKRFTKLFMLNNYLSFPPMWLTIYCFASVPKKGLKRERRVATKIGNSRKTDRIKLFLDSSNSSSTNTNGEVFK